MTETHTSSPGTGTESDTISRGWRAFQVLGLLTALSWLGSYLLFVGPFQWLGGLFSGNVPSWGTVVFDFSPIVSILIVLLAISPRSLRFIQGANWKAYTVRIVAFLIPAAWMLNVFVGTPMVDKLITQPMAPSKMVPLFAGVFLHVVLQHWFQAIVAIAFTLVPEKFATLTASETPAGVQCAVVQCE